MKGEPEYVKGKSYLTITEHEAQQVVDEKHGTGEAIKNKSGVLMKEKIECGIEIGVDVDQKTGIETPTDKGTIHYSKTGTHLVPRKEKKHD